MEHTYREIKEEANRILALVQTRCGYKVYIASDVYRVSFLLCARTEFGPKCAGYIAGVKYIDSIIGNDAARNDMVEKITVSLNKIAKDYERKYYLDPEYTTFRSPQLFRGL